MSGKRFQKRLLLFLAVLGPGIITAVADNDAAGVATYTVAASLYGMASQFMVLPTTLLLAVTQEVGARLSIVTGKGIGELIREHYGVRVSVIIFLLYYFVNQIVVLQDISGLKASLQLLAIPWQLGLVVICAVFTIAVVRLNFKKLQMVFLTMILFYLAYVFSAVLAKPNWLDAMRESFVYPRHIALWNMGYWFSLIAVLGTTVTAWGQFFISSFIVDKGLTAEHIKEEKVEVYGSALVTNFFSWMIALCATSTLFVHGIRAVDGYTAAQAIAPFAGQFAGTLFAVGLFGASLLGLIIVPLATSYVFTELFGFERTLNSNFKSGRPFYVFFILQIIIGLALVMLPRMNLFDVTLYANYLNGAILPVIFYFIITFSENKKLMGQHASRGFTKFFIRFCAVIISVAVVVTFVGGVLGKLK